MTNTAMTATAEVSTAVKKCETVSVPVADYSTKPCAECGRNFTALRAVLLCGAACERDRAARLEREAAAKFETTAALITVLVIADKLRMNAADGRRRCLNPLCDKNLTGRKNRKCCNAKCRLAFSRHSATGQLKIAEDKKAKLGRKRSDAAANLRPSSTSPYHATVVSRDSASSIGAFAKTETHYTTTEVSGDIKVAVRSSSFHSYSTPLPSGVLPPVFRTPKESIETIPLAPFYESSARRAKEEAKLAKWPCPLNPYPMTECIP